MRKKNVFIPAFTFLLFFFVIQSRAQLKDQKFHFMGGFGLSVNSQFFSVSLQPGLLYQINEKFALGTAVQYSYAKSNKNYYGVNFSRHMYGGNFFGLYNPIRELELSVEYEALRINEIYNEIKDNYWSPALFGGVGYRTKAFAVGFKFNFLQNENSIYKDALVPYVRIYF